MRSDLNPDKGASVIPSSGAPIASPVTLGPPPARLRNHGQTWFWRFWNAAGTEHLRCFDCSSALDIRGLRPGSNARCGHCGSVFSVPGSPVVSHKPADSVTGIIEYSSLGGATEHETAVLADGEGKPLPPAQTPASKTIGVYELEEEIARGGMGAVFKARHRRLGKPVAIKLLLSSLGASEELERRMVREALALAHFRHPNIVPVLDAGVTDDGNQYMVMELVDGEDLAKRIARDGQLNWREALGILAQLADGVDFAHSRGVIHRDLKPGNVLLDENGQAKLVDFGLARDESAATNLTRTGTALGTPAYMPPEQARGDRENVTRRSDIYGLGAILYEMLTGQQPFQGETAMQVLYKVVQEDPAAPRSLAPDVPRDVEAVCLKAMEKDPARRYVSAYQFLQDIRACLNGDLPPTACAGRGLAIRRGFRRLGLGRWRNIALLLAVVILLGWLGARMQRSKRAQQRRIHVERLVGEGEVLLTKGDLDGADEKFIEAQNVDRLDASAHVGRRKVAQLKREAEREKEQQQQKEISQKIAQVLVKMGPDKVKETVLGSTNKVTDLANMLEDLMGGLNPLKSSKPENEEAPAVDPAPSVSPQPSSRPPVPAGRLFPIVLNSKPGRAKLRVIGSDGKTVFFEGSTPVRVSLVSGVYFVKYQLSGADTKSFILTVSDRHPRDLVLSADGARPAFRQAEKKH